MVSSLKIEIDKFNGKSFELWKLKMEDLLVDKDQWIVVDPGTAPTGMSTKDWKSWIGREEHNPVVSLRFNITECVKGSYNQDIMG
jgi:hypothetical protein